MLKSSWWWRWRWWWVWSAVYIRRLFCYNWFRFTCFACFHFSFRVPTFPTMPFCDPREAAVRLLRSAVGFMRRRIEWKHSSIRRAISQEEELLTWLSNLDPSIFCLRGRLCPLQPVPPCTLCEHWSKMAAQERSCLIQKDGNRTRTPLLVFTSSPIKLLDLEKAWKVSPKRTGKVLDALKLQHHQTSSVCLRSLHPRISSPHPEANPVMEILDDTAAV